VQIGPRSELQGVFSSSFAALTRPHLSTLNLTEPDLKNRDLMLATYERSVCGLRDRAQIDAALHSSDMHLTP
jgi:hypothetical protein